MRLTRFLGCLALLVVGACAEPTSETERDLRQDPGRPDTTFGPKCSIQLDLADPPVVLEQCTAIATVDGDRAHLYLELYPDREPAGLGRYVSIVLPTSAWAAGTYTSAVGGRLEISSVDERQYRLVPSAAGEFAVDLRVDSVSGPGAEGEFYVRGSLRAVLPGISGTSGDLALTADINGAN